MVRNGTATMQQQAVAEVFTTAVFRALSESRIAQRAHRIVNLAPLVEDPARWTLADAYDAGHRFLRQSYRSEYFYKNSIVSKVIFGYHRPSTASALLEFQMGASYADVVVLNGTTTTYEIKTDLDSFARLRTQLADYSARTEHVNVVTSESKAASAEKALPDHVGLVVLKRSGALGVIRPSVGGFERLNPQAMFDLLRGDEALVALRRSVGYELDVPRGDAWKRTRALYAELPADVAHRETLRALRGRSAGAVELATTDSFPASLRALAYGTELSGAARARLIQRLKQPFNVVLHS